jgi:hypothetical protein
LIADALSQLLFLLALRFGECDSDVALSVPNLRQERGTPGGGRERDWPINPPQPEPIRTAPGHHFEDAAHENTRPEPTPGMPQNLRGAPAHIWTAWHHSDNAKAFQAALDEHGMSLAAVTKKEADRSHKHATFARAVGNFAPEYREGEIVVLAEPDLAYRDGKMTEPHVYRLDRRTTGEDRAKIEKYLKPLDRTPLQGVEATKETLKARAEQRIIEVQAFRDMLRDTRNAARMKQAQQPGREAPTRAAKETASRVIGRVAKTPARAVGGLFGGAAKIADGLFEMIDPVLTPEQKREKEILTRQSEAKPPRVSSVRRRRGPT